MAVESAAIELDLETSPRFRNFDWEKAKNFYYVAKCGSFANAARFLNISQSALSRQVIYLEQQLGCPLFARHSGGIHLTRKGSELFDLVEATFIGFIGFTRSTHTQVSNGKKRKIRIATSHSVAAYLLNDLILEYNQEHPHFIFELIGDDRLTDVLLNDVDVAIRPIDLQLEDVSKSQPVQQEFLFSAEKKLYASVEYLEKYGEPQTVEDLKNHHLIGYVHPQEHPYSEVNWILKLGMPKGQLHQPVFASNSIECAISAAEKGIGIVSNYDEIALIKKSRLKNILPDVKCQALSEYFIYQNYLKGDKEIMDLKEYLQEKLRSPQVRPEYTGGV
jgi:DNA-binding transcriptional LysR family regulator